MAVPGRAIKLFLRQWIVLFVFMTGLACHSVARSLSGQSSGFTSRQRQLSMRKLSMLRGTIPTTIRSPFGRKLLMPGASHFDATNVDVFQLGFCWSLLKARLTRVPIPGAPIPEIPIATPPPPIPPTEEDAMWEIRAGLYRRMQVERSFDGFAILKEVDYLRDQLHLHPAIINEWNYLRSAGMVEHSFLEIWLPNALRSVLQPLPPPPPAPAPSPREDDTETKRKGRRWWFCARFVDNHDDLDDAEEDLALVRARLGSHNQWQGKVKGRGNEKASLPALTPPLSSPTTANKILPTPSATLPLPKKNSSSAVRVLV